MQFFALDFYYIDDVVFALVGTLRVGIGCYTALIGHLVGRCRLRYGRACPPGGDEVTVGVTVGNGGNGKVTVGNGTTVTSF